ncbi:hypothetical protein RE428_28060 [Marinobacter nanhaiticus D15-8W]|nr:hypothetical protein RE428_28060 [Marinobacter nanhaiticus D15-8W]
MPEKRGPHGLQVAAPQPERGPITLAVTGEIGWEWIEIGWMPGHGRIAMSSIFPGRGLTPSYNFLNMRAC